jgi:hypothetical protein
VEKIIPPVAGASNIQGQGFGAKKGQTQKSAQSVVIFIRLHRAAHTG